MGANEFGRCITIERDPTLARRATERFRDTPQVEVLTGSSRDQLPEVCQRIDAPAFLWLDGHWSGGETAGSDDPCPVLAELEAIRSSANARERVAAIDDMRLFGLGHSLDAQMESWPSLPDVLKALRDIGLVPFYLDDMIVGVPPTHRASFLTIPTSALRQSVPFFSIWSEFERAVSNSRHASWRSRVRRLANRFPGAGNGRLIEVRDRSPQRCTSEPCCRWSTRGRHLDKRFQVDRRERASSRPLIHARPARNNRSAVEARLEPGYATCVRAIASQARAAHRSAGAI